eukprot:gnl/TRDRNA2_/TRDRNA2_181916_c0_seq1.p1 gnl/TRDRNA2_/TRDRNA2_181916_c0~~gnl/TRDRNA2_/TRDRNA2_181916_c0_seq1.p1  ORF type:complete len:220 (+),score=23.14 gnl/TRDRNA2_/TRDRNA2_181916_c0_seq1:60-719(+)
MFECCIDRDRADDKKSKASASARGAKPTNPPWGAKPRTVKKDPVYDAPWPWNQRTASSDPEEAKERAHRAMARMREDERSDAASHPPTLTYGPPPKPGPAGEPNDNQPLPLARGIPLNPVSAHYWPTPIRAAANECIQTTAHALFSLFGKVGQVPMRILSFMDRRDSQDAISQKSLKQSEELESGDPSTTSSTVTVANNGDSKSGLHPSAEYDDRLAGA